MRVEAGVSTARFLSVVGHARADLASPTGPRTRGGDDGASPPKGPWPQQVRGIEEVRTTVRRHALSHPAWGHRKIWALTRRDGIAVSASTVMRLLRDEGLLLPAQYQRERRDLATARKAAFATPPDGPNQVWQLDFSEFETSTGGTWRIAACRDYWSKYEHRAHVSPTANMHAAVAAVVLALEELITARRGRPLAEDCPIDAETGEILPWLTIVTDNGGPFRSFTFEAFVATQPAIRHVRTRVRTPGQNGSRERGFGTLKYEWLYREDITDAVALADQVERWRQDYNHIRPHEAIAWNTPAEVHSGLATPTIPNFETKEVLPKD